MSQPEASEEESGEGRGLMFAWKRKQSVFAGLAIFGAASLLVHLFGFYLFQVVYPASGRLEPEPSRITLLNDSQPSVNSLLREVEDRLVYLRPASAGAGVRVSLGDYSSQFQPSFSDRQVTFKSIAPIAAIRDGDSAEIPDPLAPRRGETPELTFPSLAAAPKVTGGPKRDSDGNNRWHLTGDLADRALRDTDGFTDSLPDLESPPAIRFRIGVGANGAVRSFVPVAGQGHPRIGEVSRAIRGHLRFEAMPGAEVEWGWLEIRR